MVVVVIVVFDVEMDVKGIIMEMYIEIVWEVID